MRTATWWTEDSHVAYSGGPGGIHHDPATGRAGGHARTAHGADFVPDAACGCGEERPQLLLQQQPWASGECGGGQAAEVPQTRGNSDNMRQGQQGSFYNNRGGSIRSSMQPQQRASTPKRASVAASTAVSAAEQPRISGRLRSTSNGDSRSISRRTTRRAQPQNQQRQQPRPQQYQPRQQPRERVSVPAPPQESDRHRARNRASAKGTAPVPAGSRRK